MNSSNIIPLEALEIASPCKADWDAMAGDNRVRFCGSCHKNVYDFSQMSRAEAQSLLLEKEGNLCARLHRRADGTVITSDCPIGTTPPRRPLWWVGAAVSALLAAFAGLTGRPVQAKPFSALPVSNPPTSMVAGGLVAYPMPSPRTAGAGPLSKPRAVSAPKHAGHVAVSRKTRTRRLARRTTSR